MKSYGESCFICGGTEFADADRHYRRCGVCGHEIRTSGGPGQAIINDLLSEKEVKSFGLLDRFKRKVLLSCRAEDDFLLDVGTASGKFLYHNGRHFKASAGIEVSPPCIEFARTRLGLEVCETLSDIRETVSMATFWHSLEHIPVEQIGDLFADLRRVASPAIRVVVSVPNAGSYQYRLLGKRYAYYDPESHVHQFTARSLDLLLESQGFVRERAFPSFAYSAFGALQGLLNLFSRTHNYLYYRRKRGWTFGKSKGRLLAGDALNIVLSVIVGAPALLMALADGVAGDKGAVLTLCYRRKSP